MHRELLPVPPGFETDHIDGNGLNNQKDNLRISTRSQNAANSKIRVGGSSEFKGVAWNKRCRKWRATIGVERQVKHLGLFKIEEKAALAYNTAALKYFGEFARLNIVEARID